MKKLLSLLAILIVVAGSSIGTILILDSQDIINVKDKTAITFKIDDKEKVYDASPLSVDSYEIIEGELNQGHRIANVEFSGSITEVGEKETNMEVTIVDERNRNVTNDYDITIIPSTLKITKRPISIDTPKASLTYNGEFQSSSDYIISNGSLVEGHKLIPSITGSKKDVGRVNESFTPRIYNQLGIEVTSNYEIECTNSIELEIVPREIEIEPTLLETTYNKNVFTIGNNYRISSGTLAKGHTIEVQFANTNMVDAAKYNTLLNATIKDELGNDVTSNYKYNNQELYFVTINPIDVTINLPTLSKTYDAKSFEDELDYFISTASQSLPQGFTIYYNDSLLDIKNVTDIGSGSNAIRKLTEDDFTVYEANTNYNIILVPGSMKINPRTLYVYSPKLTKTYDSERFSEAQVKELTQVIGYVNNYDNDNWLNSFEITDFPLDYDCCDKDYSLEVRELYDNKNYNVIVTPSRITINPVTINITLKNKSIVYEQNLTDLKNMLGDSYILESNVDSTITLKSNKEGDGPYTKGSYNVTVERVMVGENQVYPSAASSNYEVNINYEATNHSVLIVTSQIVEVPKALQTIFDYTGSSITNPYQEVVNSSSQVYSITSGNLLGQTNANTYEIVLSLTDSTNYAWSDGSGATRTLSWTINKIKVKQPDAPYVNIFTYTGSDITYDFGDLTDKPYQVKNTSNKAKNVGNYTATIELKDKVNYEWISQYENNTDDLNYPFTIVKKDLYVKAKDIDTWVFGDDVSAKLNALSYNDCIVTGLANEGDITNADKLEIRFTTNYSRYMSINGNYTITPSGMDVDNYNVIFVSGSVTVKPKSIKVVQDSPITKNYDGKLPIVDFSNITLNTTTIGDLDISISSFVADYSAATRTKSSTASTAITIKSVEVVTETGINITDSLAIDYTDAKISYTLNANKIDLIISLKTIPMTEEEYSLITPSNPLTFEDVVQSVSGLLSTDNITFNNVTVTSTSLNTDIPGTYNLPVTIEVTGITNTIDNESSSEYYNATIVSGCLSVTVKEKERTVHVYAKDRVIYVNQGDSFDEDAVSYIGSVIGLYELDTYDISGTINQETPVDTSIPGTYTTIYDIDSCLDVTTNTLELTYNFVYHTGTLTVVVKETERTVDVYLKDRVIYVNQGDSFSLSATDYIGSVIGISELDSYAVSGTIDLETAIDTDVPGSYSSAYVIDDSNIDIDYPSGINYTLVFHPGTLTVVVKETSRTVDVYLKDRIIYVNQGDSFSLYATDYVGSVIGISELDSYTVSGTISLATAIATATPGSYSSTYAIDNGNMEITVNSGINYTLVFHPGNLTVVVRETERTVNIFVKDKTVYLSISAGDDVDTDATLYISSVTGVSELDPYEIVGDVTITGTYNPSAVGTYTVTVSVDDSNINITNNSSITYDYNCLKGTLTIIVQA